MTIEYPTRCEIIDVTGKRHPRVPYWNLKTPSESIPHIGKQGTAYRSREGVTIELDDGNIIHGHECWWKPISGTIEA
jgi:hypothetical protein